ncbi:hypothetical protein CYLTODRAFT_385635 [Cylindrobasidium torrendii FP15055 ss-10]|uniref:CRCB-domain-containing protein n=1 Tax=Cylindrobasidium torrendii FP15055 ss-10 TaxID=1314674 RepID=A0A0D7BV72_9AGAR|nr:hypothetical protein CYLTODRAFT_385635 [Cylindrobasidium torrendii FP15055 ss-10]
MGDASQTPTQIHPFHIDVLALLFPSSLFGVLARLGLSALVTYDGQSIFPLAYAQGVGCLFMGLFKQSFTGYSPVIVALTTGFCGSLTTFSGWQLDVFESWMNAKNTHRGDLRDVVDGLTKSVFTVSISMASLFFGRYLGQFFKINIPHPSRLIRTCITVLSVLLYAAAYPLYFKLSPSYRYQATAALLWAPAGTLVRYALSVKLNRPSKIPWGTFGVNTFGTALLGILHVVQRLGSTSTIACTTLQGMADGFCGCLTTISTFAVEIEALVGKKKWAYPFGSWFVSQLLLLLVIGVALLSGIKEENMCTFEGS